VIAHGGEVVVCWWRWYESLDKSIVVESPESATPLMPLDKEGMMACCWWHCR